MAALIDVSEFVRFVVVGVTATVANLTAVWLARDYLSFQTSLCAGLLAGMSVSFILTKVAAFNSRSWEAAHGELLRFLLVYSMGALVYWLLGFVLGRFVLSPILPVRLAELVAALIGASTMTFTSYFGHRFFTYRSY